MSINSTPPTDSLFISQVLRDRIFQSRVMDLVTIETPDFTYPEPPFCDWLSPKRKPE